jgi:hypothetical protein
MLLIRPAFWSLPDLDSPQCLGGCGPTLDLGSHTLLCDRMSDFQQSERVEHRVRAQLHGALRRREVPLIGEFLHRFRV